MYNKKLRPTKNGEPCPICGKTNGNCRISGDSQLILCMTAAGGLSDPLPFKYIGDTTDGSWGKFISESGSYTNEKKQQYQQYKHAQEKAQTEAYKGSLSIEERDKNIRIIADYLGLNQSDEQKLLQRGLTPAQIKAGKYFSVRPFTKIPSQVSTRLAGVYVDKDGDLAIGTEFLSGIACPTFNRDGLITGYQVRRDVQANKYVWAVTGEKKDSNGTVIRNKISSHLPTGELPLSFHGTKEYALDQDSSPSTENKDSSPSTEDKDYSPSTENKDSHPSTGDKDSSPEKQFASFQGENSRKKGENSKEKSFQDSTPHPSSPLNQSSTNKSNCQPKSRGFKKKKLFMVDGPSKAHFAHCRHNIDVVGASGGNYLKCIQQFLEIAKDYWQVFYTLDGGDLLNRLVLNRIKKTYHLLKQHGIELKFAWYGQVFKEENDLDEIDDFYYETKSFEQILELAEKAQFVQKKLDTLKQYTHYTPDQTINQQFIADELNKIDFINKVLGVRSCKNSGKTFWLNELLKYTEQPIILLGNRRALVSICCEQLRIYNITQEDTADDVLDCFNSDGRIGIVIDSALKLNLINWEEAIVIIDEAEQFLSSLLLSKTHIESVRPKVLALLAEKLPLVNSVILLDADLSDFTVNYFANISQKQSFKLLNEYRENYRKLFIHSEQDNGESLLVRLDELISQGEQIFLVSDSATTLAAIYQAYQEKGVKSILLTRDNLSDNPALNRFVENQGRAIYDEGIQLILASPVIQSGVSIEIGDYFTEVLGLFYGAVSTNIVRQMLVRDRSQADRHVWVRERGIKYQNEFDYREILKTEDFKDKTLLETTKYYQYLESLSQRQAVQKVNSLFNDDDCIRDFNAETRAKLIAKRNIQFSDYGAILLDELKAEGYEIEEVSQEGYSIPLMEIKQEFMTQQSVRVNEAPLITEGEAKILERSDSLTRGERDKLLKFKIVQSLPDYLLTPEFILEYILKDRFKVINHIKNYYLANNPEIAEKLDKNGINYQVSQGLDCDLLWTADLKHNTLAVKIYQELNLGEILNNPNLVINRDWLVSFEKKCRPIRRLLRVFGIKWNHKTYKGVLAKKVFELFGFTLKCKSKKKGTSTINKVKENWDEIYASLARRFSGEIELRNPLSNDIRKNGAQNQTGQDLSEGTKSGNSFNTPPVSPPPSSPEPIRDREGFSSKMKKSGEKANSEPENVADNLGEKTNSVWGENDDFVPGNFEDNLSESESVESEANSGGDSISKKEQPSELEQIESFKFNPKRINSDLVGQTISDVFDEAKKGIVKAVYEFKTRFYADVEWCDGNFEEYYSFSHYRQHITQKNYNL